MTPDELRDAYLRITPDPDMVDAFLAAGGDRRLDTLPRLGLVVIGPESFGLGVAADLVHGIVAAGFRLVALRTRWLTPEDTAAMFIPGWIPERFRWWLIQQRWTSGPSAAVLVTPWAGGEASGPLTERKGYRIPSEAHPDTWRGGFPSINGVLDLLHTADTPAYVLRNAVPFFTGQELCTALDAVADGDILEPERMADLLRGFEQPGVCRPFELVYLTLLQRMVVGPGDEPPERVRKALREAVDAVRADHRHRLANLRGPADRAALKRDLAEPNDLALRAPGRLATPLVPVWAPQVRRAIAAVADHAAGTGTADPRLAVLTDLAGAPHKPWDRIVGALLAERLVQSEWDALILTSTLYYTDQELPYLTPAADPPSTAERPR